MLCDQNESLLRNAKLLFFAWMSLRPVDKFVGIGNVSLGTELVDIAEYDLDIPRRL